MTPEIVLYTLVPEGEATRRLPIPSGMRLRFRFGDLLDSLRWRTGGRFAFRSYRYERFLCSNRGDAAVRAAVAAETSRRLPPGCRVRQLRWGSLSPEGIEAINREASALVVAGGGYLSADAEGRLAPRCLNDIELFERLSVPLVSFGIGLNVNIEGAGQGGRPRLDDRAASSLARFVRRHALLGVRDPVTRDCLERVSGRQVRLAPDPVFFLEPGPRLRSARAGKAAAGGAGDAGAGPVIGLNFAFHGELPERNLARNLGDYIAMLRRLRRRSGCRFVYFRHADPERLVARLLRRAGLLDGLVEDPDPSAMIAAYGGVDLVIGEMMHSAIMALAAGTPVVSVGYDVKHRALFDLLGLEGWLVEGDRRPAEAVEARALDLLDDLASARRDAGRAVAALESPYGTFARDYGALLDGLQAEPTGRPPAAAGGVP